jgi:hypothetical protein
MMDIPILLHDGLCWTYPTSICHVHFHDTTRLVGLPLRGVRVFWQFARLGVVSAKMALSRPTHQRVTHTVGREEIWIFGRGLGAGWLLIFGNEPPILRYSSGEVKQALHCV